MKKPILFYDNQKVEGLRPNSNNVYVCCNNVIIKDKTLGIEIDLKDKISQINKIIIDGIVFVKEELEK